MKAILFVIASVVLSLAIIPQAAESDTDLSDEWHIYTLSAVISSKSSLALDSFGYPHIGYPTVDGLQYTKWNGTGWETEIVDSRISGTHLSIAIGKAGHPHIAYTVGDDLWYAKRTESGWTKGLVDSKSYVRDVSLALDSKGTPHISYQDWLWNCDLKLAMWTGPPLERWKIYTVASDRDVGEGSSLAFDSEDNLHISFIYDYQRLLKYANRSEGEWHFEGPGSIAVGVTSIALDKDDRPHISHGYAGCGFAIPPPFKYARLTADGWKVEEVDPEGGGYWSSIALDSQDIPHISYYDPYYRHRDLKYVRWSGSRVIETVDSDGIVGYYPSLAVDGQDNPHISYHDYTNKSLKYATKARLNPGPVASLPESPLSPSPGGGASSLPTNQSLALWNRNYSELAYRPPPDDPWPPSLKTLGNLSAGTVELYEEFRPLVAEGDSLKVKTIDKWEDATKFKAHDIYHYMSWEL